MLAERFELEEPLGSGGMASVFRARDHETDSMVAVKILRVSTDVIDQRFAREAALLAGLSHPGIVEFVAHGTCADGTHYLAMEWVPGTNLAARLADEGMTAPEAVLVIQRLAEALGAAHALGIVHRDVKPANVLFPADESAQVKLIDFGVARPAHQTHGLTQTGMLVGTPAYMSPEQASGERDVDARSDVFSLGCVLYECLTGRAPFAGSHVMAIQAKIVLSHPPPLRSICGEATPELAELLERMMAKAPEQRPTDGAEVARALAEMDAPEEGRRRRSLAHQAEDTLVTAPTCAQKVVFTVIATVVAKSEETARIADEMRALAPALRERIVPLGGHLVILGDGSLVVTVKGKADAQEAATRAAQCAVALREKAPRALVAVMGAPPGCERPLEGAVDACAKTLAEEAMQAIFAKWAPGGGGAGAIRLDEATARLLRDRFTVSEGGAGRWYLQA